MNHRPTPPSLRNLDEFLSFVEKTPAREGFALFSDYKHIVVEDRYYKFVIKFYDKTPLYYSFKNKSKHMFARNFSYKEMGDIFGHNNYYGNVISIFRKKLDEVISSESEDRKIKTQFTNLF